MKVVRSSSLCTDRLYPLEIALVLISVREHSTVRKIQSMKNSSYPIAIQTRDLPACSAVHHITAFSKTFIIHIYLIELSGIENVLMKCIVFTGVQYSVWWNYWFGCYTALCFLSVSSFICLCWFRERRDTFHTKCIVFLRQPTNSFQRCKQLTRRNNIFVY